MSIEAINRNVTIKALRPRTKNLISALLNPVKIFKTDNNLQRDWQGLADLCKIKGELFPSLLSDNDPTDKVLELWWQDDVQSSTIDKFLAFLRDMDRYDVVDDIAEMLDEDIKYFVDNPQLRQQLRPKPINLDADKYILTRDDVVRISEGLEPQIYDAFVLFAEDDIDFATKLIETMENHYKMKFCVKERDLVAGGLEYNTIIKLITERCKRLIVILSDAFFDSPANNFLLSLSQYIEIVSEQSLRKLIPCVYKECNSLPINMSGCFLLDFRREDNCYNPWDKLRYTISAPNAEATDKLILNRSKSEKIQTALEKSNQKSVLHHKNNFTTLKPINNVKFNSMVNLSDIKNDTTAMEEQSLSTKSSTSSLTMNPENGNKAENSASKSKKSWLKKILHINSDVGKNKTVLDSEKEKRKFWNKQNKRKVALAN